MTAAVFDTLKFAKRLKEAGFTETQAEALAAAQAEFINETLATKRDLKELEYRLIIRLGGLIAFAVGAVAALVKLP